MRDRTEFSERSRLVASSPTQRVAVEADTLRRRGVDVVDLGAGEPDFPTPDHVKDAGRMAIRKGFTKYTPNAGIPELRQAICSRYEADYGIKFEPDQVIVTAGGKQALFNVAMALLDPGDEVITHSPGWPTIVDQVMLADGRPVIVRTHAEDRFRVNADAMIDAVGPRARAIVINSPGNPTGGLIDEDDLAAIARAVTKQGIWIVLDLCYEQLIHDNISHNLPRVLQEAAPNRFALVGSLSKSYAMTGWRCGWAIGPESLIAACNNIQSHCTSNVSSVTQHAGVTALTGSQTCIAEMRSAYRERRDAVLGWLKKEPRLRCVRPAGAFYLFPDVTELLSPDTVRTTVDFAAELLRRNHVALTPGEAFDAPGFIRLSYAASLGQLEEGINRILDFVAAIDRGEVRAAGSDIR